MSELDVNFREVLEPIREYIHEPCLQREAALERQLAETKRHWCAYCSFGDGEKLQTLAQLQAHVEVCEYHPMRKVERKLAEVQAKVAHQARLEIAEIANGHTPNVDRPIFDAITVLQAFKGALWKERLALKATLEQAREALLKYGEHKYPCNTMSRAKGRCDCELGGILVALDAGKEAGG